MKPTFKYIYFLIFMLTFQTSISRNVESDIKELIFSDLELIKNIYPTIFWDQPIDTSNIQIIKIDSSRLNITSTGYNINIKFKDIIFSKRNIKDSFNYWVVYSMGSYFKLGGFLFDELNIWLKHEIHDFQKDNVTIAFNHLKIWGLKKNKKVIKKILKRKPKGIKKYSICNILSEYELLYSYRLPKFAWLG